MLRKLLIKIVPVLILSFLAQGVISCTTNVNPSSTNLPEPPYAGAITENMLLALNNNDYNKFIQDFDSTMKSAVSQDVFNNQFINGIKGKIGDYKAGSKNFFQAANQAQYTIVVYSGQYSNEPGTVLIQVTFQQIEGKPYIAGLLWNSPKLRGS